MSESERWCVCHELCSPLLAQASVRGKDAPSQNRCVRGCGWCVAGVPTGSGDQGPMGSTLCWQFCKHLQAIKKHTPDFASRWLMCVGERCSVHRYLREAPRDPAVRLVSRGRSTGRPVSPSSPRPAQFLSPSLKNIQNF